MFRRVLSAQIVTVVVCACAGAPEGSAEGAKSVAQRPTIIVGGTVDCPFCLQLKQRLAKEASLQPLVRQCNVRFVDIGNPLQAAAMSRQFGLERLAAPTMVIADASGKAVKVQYGMPVGDGLRMVLEGALAPLGIHADAPAAPDKDPVRKERPAQKSASDAKDESAQAEIAALRQARKMLAEGKTAEAVAVVTPYAESAGKSDAMRNLIANLIGEGRKSIAAATRKIDTPAQAWVGAVSLVKARREYGALPALKPELTAAVTKLENREGGSLLQQAEALNRGRALDEGGEKDAAITTYRNVIAQFPNTPAAAMADKRIKQLQQ